MCVDVYQDGRQLGGHVSRQWCVLLLDREVNGLWLHGCLAFDHIWMYSVSVGGGYR